MSKVAHNFIGDLYGIFVTFSPEISEKETDKIFALWYMDEKLDGNFKNMATIDKKWFTQSNPEMNWYKANK